MDNLAKKILIEQTLPIFLRVSVNDKALPCLEVRQQVNDLSVMKALISSAYHDIPLITLPQFRDKLRALAKLQEMGVIFRRYNDEKKQNDYFFNI